ncbi:MAG: hypothetical protein EBS19_11790 [Spirochaetia bacterium]|nr:hypothetical protein [Spirochaetia bacterium]
MKKFLLVLLLFSFTAHAQQTAYKAVMCADTQSVITALTGKEYKEKPSYMPSIEIPAKMSDDVLSFLNMPTKEAASFTRSLDETNLNKYYIQIRDFFFDLEDKYSTAMERIRRDKKIAEKQGEDWIIPALEREEISVKHHLRKNIDKLKGRVNTLEREMRNRRNVTQTV